MKQTVHIIGAGFSGLTLAYRLSERGIPVEIYEKSQRPGGLIGTLPMQEGFAETAASAISRTARVEKLCSDLGLSIQEPAKIAKNRYIFRRYLRKWPLNFFETLVLVAKVCLAKISGRIVPHREETLHEWGKRNLGQSASHYLLETAMQGVYAGDANQLSASLILGPLFKKDRERFKGVIGFYDGMTELLNALTENIQARGGKFHYGQKVQLQELSGPVVIATDVRAAAEILGAHHQEIAMQLKQVETLPLVKVTANFPKKNLPEGFGCLIPRGERLSTLGVLINSSMFDRGWDFRSETWILGGAAEKTVLELSNESIQELILRERQTLFKDQSLMREMHVTRWPHALPHYSVALERVLEKISPLIAKLEEKKIYLHGNYLSGIGLSKILERTDHLAEKISESQRVNG